jgi:erythromycin esterase
VPRPEPDWGDRPLGDANLDQFAVDLHADAPPAVRTWRQAATTVRAVGSFDPQQPDAYYMTGGSLAQWFDVIVHRQVVTPWQPL